MRRWTCPNGCPGVRAPERMAHHDVRGYCLPCSARTGELVRRTCPTRAHEGAARKARRAATARKAATRNAERRLADRLDQDLRAAPRRRGLAPPGPRVVLGLDVDKLARRVWGLLGQLGPVPTIAVVRPDARGSQGTAWPQSRRVRLTFGLDADLAKVCMLVLHELAHVAAGPGQGHGPVLGKLLAIGARLTWGIVIPEGPRGYGPTDLLERALRKKLARPRRRGVILSVWIGSVRDDA